jgi:hypothetical protein
MANLEPEVFKLVCANCGAWFGDGAFALHSEMNHNGFNR